MNRVAITSVISWMKECEQLLYTTYSNIQKHLEKGLESLQNKKMTAFANDKLEKSVSCARPQRPDFIFTN